MWTNNRTWPRFLVVCIGITIGVVTLRSVLRRDPQPEPLHARTQLVKRLVGEAASETARNVARFDDALWAAASLGNMPDEPTSYKYLSAYLPSLSRVRKLLQMPVSERAEVTPILRGHLRNALEGFDGAEKALRAKMGAALRDNRMHVESEDAPSAYSEFLVAGPASAYLLACFSDGQSLPVMMQAYRGRRLLPMDRTFLFYSMHLIAIGHPRDGLSNASAAALDEYLADAGAIPSPDQVRCPGWDDPFDQTDFRARMVGLPLPSDPKKQFTLLLYPALRAEDGTQIWGTWDSPPEMDRLAKRLERFISLAYGQ